MPDLIKAYAALTKLASPLIALHIKRRARFGKEDKERIGERFGKASVERPRGKLFWFHAASIGEAFSCLQFLELVKTKYPEVNFLITTGTVTSAKLLSSRLQSYAIHQFTPIDTPQAVARFLDHWQPDFSVFLESELWPNLLLAAKKRAIPLALINARISDSSARNWSFATDAIIEILSSFRVIFAQSERDKAHFSKLSQQEAFCVGNLKHDAKELEFDEKELKRVKQNLAARKVFVCASIHPGEEMIIANAIFKLKNKFPELITIIAPRHPHKGKDMENAIGILPLEISRRLAGEEITSKTDIYIADTIGELGLWYAVADVAFVGGSLIEHGGQNPLEPIRQNVPVLFGSHMFNFEPTAEELLKANAAIEIKNEDDFVNKLGILLANKDKRNELVENARKWLAAKPPVSQILLEKLTPLFNEALR